MKFCLANCKVGDKLIWGQERQSTEKYEFTVTHISGSYVEAKQFNESSSFFTSADLEPGLDDWMIVKIIKVSR